MTLHSPNVCTQLCRFLAEPALRALALAALAGLTLAAARVRDAVVRLAVWTAVLYAAMAMPFLARVAPAVRLPIPALLTAQSASPPVPSGVRTMLAIGTPATVSTAPVPSTRLGIAKPERTRTFSWPLAGATLYLLIAGVLLARLAVGFLLSRRVALSSSPIKEQRVMAMLRTQSTRCGLGAAPELAESPAVAVPVALGVRHPIILLPVGWRDWSDEKTQAVLAHELSHVVRKDALTRALAAIHRCVFWFSPLSWWLERHLAALAEQASDDAALGTGADRTLYASVLLDFYRDLQNAVGRVQWEGVAMTSGKQAQRRVERILDSNRRLSAGLQKPALAALLLVAGPVIYLLAGTQPVAAHKLGREDGRVLKVPVRSPAAESMWAGVQAEPAAPATPAAPAAPAPAPKAPAPPRPPSDRMDFGNSGEDFAITDSQSVSASGTFRDSDLEHLRALRKRTNADFIWFRRDSKAYLIRDAATVQQAKALLAPQEALGKQQEELGRQQEALGAQQEELGKQMDQVRVEVPDLTAELQKLQAQLDQLHKHGGTQEELGNLQAELGDLQGKLGEIQGKAGEQEGAIGARQGELGALQGKFGEQQGKLGEQQARLAREASRKMKALLDNALAKGLAQPE
jgi:beta-lactamase regulating signal transducer with metallopeptidase domain